MSPKPDKVLTSLIKFRFDQKYALDQISTDGPIPRSMGEKPSDS